MERRSIIFGASIALTMALTAPTIAAGMEMNQGGMNLQRDELQRDELQRHVWQADDVEENA